MKNNLRIALSLLLVTVFVFGFIQPAKACGPFSIYAAFSYDKHPDLPMEKFARGELGIMKTSYAQSYLVVAYRYLNGLTLNPQEQAGVLKLWEERLGRSSETTSDGVADWREARKKVQGVGDSPEISTERSVGGDSYQSYTNCLPDAFNKATQTLNERVNRFGADNQNVKDWVAAQDKVFSNCSEGQNIPGNLTANAPAPFKADRAYQIASAYFYSANYDEAKTRFERISSDSSSPYNAVSSFLIARSLIRKASITEKPGASGSTLSQAETQLKKVLSDRKFSAFHTSARNLLGIVGYRLRPTERLRELAQNLSRGEANANIKQDLWDYTMLMDNVPFGDNVNTEVEPKIPYTEVVKDDLTDWILTFQSGAKGFNHAVDKWGQTASQSWLVAALTTAKSGDAKVNELINAADKINGTSPAFFHVQYHIARLLIETGQKDEARKRLDLRVPGRTNSSPTSLESIPSTFNQFLSLRMNVATSLDDFLKYAARKPAAYVWDDDGNEMPDTESDEAKGNKDKILFDFDATNIMDNLLPLSVLQSAAQNKQLPNELRLRLALAVLTKAIILDRHDVGRAIAPTVSQLAPEIKLLVDSYLKTQTPIESKSAGIYLILKTPATRPYVDSGLGRGTTLTERDSYRDNWWCAEAPKLYYYNNEGEQTERKIFAFADFLTEAQKTAAKSETTKLNTFGTAPNYLAQQTVLWAGRSPTDPRVPEALHLAVAQATRYGCTDEGTGKASKAAYDLLHKRYPKSEWATKTPYWYKGN